MAEPCLDGPSVVPLVSEGVSTGVAEHVRVRPAAPAARSIIRAKPAVVNGDPRSLTKTNGDVSLSRWSRRRARSSSPRRGWVLGVPFLTRRTCSTPASNSTWSPAQVAELGRPKPMPEGQQDHGRVPVTVAVRLGGLDQGLDLPGRQVLPGTKFGVGASGRRNCSIYFGWCDQPEVRLRHGKRPFPT
jgi:hypothetical protein